MKMHGWHTWASALTLIATCGLAQSVAHAQNEKGSRPSRARQDEMRGGSQTSDALKERQELLRQQRDAARQRAENEQNRPSAQATGTAGAVQGGSSTGRLIDAEGNISINFTGPVELSAFLDYVSRAKGLTIRATSIPSSTITFYAPVTIPAEQLVPLTQSILEDNNLSLVFDESSNTWVVRQIAQLPVGSGTTRIFPTPLLSPSALQGAINQQLAGGQGSAGARFTALNDLGVLIVTATPRTLDTVQTLIDRITEQIDAQKLYSFDISEVSASYARDRILTLVGEGIVGQTNTPRPQAAPGAASAGIGGTFSNIQSRLFVDSGNRLLLRGTETERGMLRELIDLVDVVTQLDVKRYLVGISAAQVAQSGAELGLGDVTEISAGASSGQRGFGGRGFGTQQGTQQQAGQPSASQFVLDTETGSFIYYGTPSQHERVQALVDEFKKTDLGDTIEIRTYPLKYASVEPIGDNTVGEGVRGILEQLLTDPQQRTNQGSPFLPATRGGAGAAGGAGADLSNLTAAELTALTAQTSDAGAGAVADLTGQGGGEGVGTRLIATTENTIIVADESRNQLIIKAPRKAHEQLARLIDQLDQRQQQVYLEIQIVSVLSNKTFDFAADVQISAGQFSFLSSFGLTSAADGADPFAPRSVGQGNAGVTSAIIRSDFVPIAINALETLGTTRTLSKPQILTNNNQIASYVSQSEVPFASTVQGNTSTVTSQGGTATAGTTIEVTPRISTGGYVTLEGLNVELSSFTGDAIGNLQPPTQVDTYSSNVTLPSDSTIVVGGFQLDINSETNRKVPLLGDIPLVGLLFQDIGEQKNTTTVYIFITPRIINDTRSSDMRLITEGPMKEMGIPDDMPELEFVTVPVRGRMPARELPRNDESDAVLSAVPNTSEASG